MWVLPPERTALPALDVVLGVMVEHQALGSPRSWAERSLPGQAPPA